MKGATATTDISAKEDSADFTLEGWLKLAEQDASEDLEPPLRLVDLLEERLAS